MRLTEQQKQNLIKETRSILERFPVADPTPDFLSYEEVMGNLGRCLFPALVNHLEQAAQGREKATSFEVGQEKDLAGSEKSDKILI